LLLIAVIVLPVAAAERSSLTAAPRIARVYDTIFNAQFDQVPGVLAQTCARGDRDTSARRATAEIAPAEVCQLLEVQAVWWRMQLDPFSTEHDAEYQTKTDAAIAAIDAWTRREPGRAEAWFYLGGAYGARVQWRVLRGQNLSAARDGKRIKDALEHALELDPNLQDAYFGIGLYHYYADVAPAAAKLLRILLLLPGGDRVQGLKEMIRARDNGQLLRAEADYQLHLLYLWYEKNPDRALQLLRQLQNQYPHNPYFTQLIAEVEDVYRHDHTASLAVWRSLLDASRSRRVAEPAMSEVRARLGLALELDHVSKPREAIEHLKIVVNMRPQAPVSALALAHWLLGQTLDLTGDRQSATVEYRAALQTIPSDDPLKIEPKARAALRRR
jgi:tetratricopeptide (TPR) repeat protein